MKKKIAVHINKNSLFDDRWPEFIEKFTDYEFKPVNLKSVDAIEQIKDCDGVMWHFLHSPDDKNAAPKILNVIEHKLNIPVWPDFNTRWHFDEKIAQHYLFQASRISSIKSWCFWNYEEADNFLKQTEEYPFVFKLSVGAGSSNVIKLDNYRDAKVYLDVMFKEGVFPYTFNEFKSPKNLLRQMFYGIRYILFGKYPRLPNYYQVQKNYFYIQKFLPNNQYDIRITVIGKKAFGFIRYNRNDDFRASGSGKLEVNPQSISLDVIKTALDFAIENKLQSVGMDFLKDENGQFLLNEISYGYVDSAIYNCPGYWDENLVWHEGHFWPEQFHVEDFVQQIEELNSRKK